MKLSTHDPLIVIDVQKAFSHPSWGKRNNPYAEENIEKLINHWRANGRPIIFVQHISEREESLFHHRKSTSEFMDFIQPLENELVMTKSVNSSFIGTKLESILREFHGSHVVITGLTTNHCVETTTRMAGNLGFNPLLVSDATACFDRKGISGELFAADLIHSITLANLHKEFAEIVDTSFLLDH